MSHSEDDGEQGDKTIWYYSTKVRSYFPPGDVVCSRDDSSFSFILCHLYCKDLLFLYFTGVFFPLLLLLFGRLLNFVLQVQLAEVIDCLDKEYWEADLYSALEEIRDEVHAHMDISEDLTNKTRGNNKSFLTAANGKE